MVPGVPEAPEPHLLPTRPWGRAGLLHPPHHRGGRWPRGVCCVLWVPSIQAAAGGGGAEGTNQNDWNFPSCFALTICTELQPLIRYRTSQKRNPLRWEENGSAEVFDLSTTRGFGTLWIERLTPPGRGQGRPGDTPSPVPAAWPPPPPRSSCLDLSLPGHLSSIPLKALVCCVPSPYGFCNKKKC